jgi:DNA-binding MarR family transcriptional regulator
MAPDAAVRGGQQPLRGAAARAEPGRRARADPRPVPAPRAAPTLAQLAEAHGVDHPYATIIVDKLEALGFAERRPHPSDRRSKLVSLTPAGQEVATQAERILSEPPAALLALTTGQLTQLTDLLSRLSG